MLLGLLTSQHSSIALTFLVDALDEYDNISILDLISLFKELCTLNSSISINICVLSRYIPPIASKKYPSFSLKEKTLDDISNYVKDELIKFVLEEEQDFL